MPQVSDFGSFRVTELRLEDMCKAPRSAMPNTLKPGVPGVPCPALCLSGRATGDVGLSKARGHRAPMQGMGEREGGGREGGGAGPTAPSLPLGHCGAKASAAEGPSRHSGGGGGGRLRPTLVGCGPRSRTRARPQDSARNAHHRGRRLSAEGLGPGGGLCGSSSGLMEGAGRRAGGARCLGHQIAKPEPPPQAQSSGQPRS